MSIVTSSTIIHTAIPDAQLVAAKYLLDNGTASETVASLTGVSQETMSTLRTCVMDVHAEMTHSK